MEVLHTALLGACKIHDQAIYKELLSQKKEILARMVAFSCCRFSVKVHGNISYYYQSFRDFKAWVQMAIFIIEPYLTAEVKKCWLLLSKVIYNNN